MIGKDLLMNIYLFTYRSFLNVNNITRRLKRKKPFELVIR
jgi:hypothetical protein